MLTYSLHDVENWERNAIIAVPALQRGLVWEPHQVELLWDSILRGFPIGAFAFTPIKGNESQLTTPSEKEEEHGAQTARYFLLDGQQRYNAIKAAFTPWTDDAKSVLWVEFMPKPNTGSTRRFWVKATTKAHPWGFENNDTCSVLGWRTYREALARFTGSEATRIQDVKMSQAWPIKARCPVPFSTVLDIFDEADGSDAFCNGVIAWCKGHESVGIENKDFNVVARTAQTIFAALERMHGYQIVANVLKPETLEDRDIIEEGDLSDDGTNSLEQLFTRINTLGTPISPYDLRYSAIKAYWAEIKNGNDEIAGTIMPAANLAIFAFRLALTLASERKGFADTPSVQRIRGLRSKDDAESQTARGIVDELYGNGGERLRNMIRDVETALCVFKRGGSEDGLPAVLRTSMILNSPDVYLLLLYMAYKGRLGDFGNISGLAMWLHWFSVDQQKKIVDEIKAVVDEGDLAALKRVLADLCGRKALMYPVEAAPENFLDPMKFLKNEGKECDWTTFESEPWYPLFDRIWSQRELVIFATRRYFNQEFQYDPAETKFLTGHNRPWDIDHIIPKSWVSRQGVGMGPYQTVCRAWIWSNGNYAAIPFTMNRSKGNRQDWAYYLAPERKRALFFDECFLGLESDTMTSVPSMAMSFVQTAHARMIALYGEWRKGILNYLE
jgi:hypothetical protein